jgi:hypothetical protein
MELRGGFVEEAVQDAVHRKRGGKIAVIEVGLRREGAKQRVERLAAAAHRQR